MKNQKKIQKAILTFFVFFLVLNLGIAQPTTINPLVEKDEKTMKAMKEGGETKGIISYDVMKNIMQNDVVKQIKFDVSVSNEQKVIVEIFNEYGELVEVVYNDFMKPNEETKFWLSGKDWDNEIAYYLRVTTSDSIENHEIVFDEY